MKQTLKQKKLTKQIKNNSFCKVTPQDIYDNTDFFKQTKQPYKLAFIVSVIVVFISITMISVLGYQNFKLLTRGPEIVYVDNQFTVIDDTKGMTEEEKLELKNQLDFFSFETVCCFAHDKFTIVYIYYGFNINDDGSYNYHYYYAISDTLNYRSDINILINETVLVVNLSNKIGLLTTIDGRNTNEFTLEFTVSTKDRTAKYVLKDCNY